MIAWLGRNFLKKIEAHLNQIRCDMKWRKFPSDDMFTQKLLKQCDSIKGIHDITNWRAIAYYMFLLDVKNKRRRKHGKFRNIPKIFG